MAFSTKELNDIISDFIINVVNNVDNVTDANVGAVMRQFIESLSIELRNLYVALDTVYQGTRIDTATGEDLEQLGKILGISRKSGTKAIGNVTFKRTTVPSSDFNISGGLIISTQPNTGDDQLRFITSSTVTYYSSIVGESHTFKEGYYDYKMDERFIGNTSAVAIVGTYSSTPTTFTINTDFGIVSAFDGIIVDPTSVVTIDTCDVADWTETDDATAQTTSTDKKQGSYSLNLGKSGTSSIYATYSKLLGTVVDGNNKDLVLYLSLLDDVEINKIDKIYVYACSGGSITNSYQFRISGTQLYSDWNLYRLRTGDASTIRNGIPSISSINYLRIQIITKSSTSTIALGNIKMDYWTFSDTEEYEGDIVRWNESGTNPDDSTAFETDYSPLSKEVECVSENIGADYNVNKNKIIYQVSNIPNINSVNNYNVMSGGSDEETDDDLRERILYATELKGKATAESIRQAVLAVEGVTSVSVEDLPRRNVTSEAHLYTSGTSIYKLDNEVLYLDSVTSPTNIIVSGLASATSNIFVFGTDYTARYDTNGAITSEIEWQLGGTSPDTDTIFSVDYYFDWLGHANVFVSGVESPLPASVLADIDDAIEESKAAGISINVTEPSPVYVDITASVSPDTNNGYSFNDIETNVEDALFNHLNSLEVGEDVYIAKLYDIIMSVLGTKNASITLPASDTTIDTSEIAKPGTITISQL